MSVIVTPGELFVLTGLGFGLDVAIEVGGIPVADASTNRVSESEVRFPIPITLPEGLHDLKITNVEADVSFTEEDAIEVPACDLELLELILRGDIGGASRPLAKLTFIDDDGTEVDISADVKTLDIIQKRDDRRTDLALLAPPAATLRASLFNVDKRFTPGADGIFEGKMDLGRVLKASVGYIVNGTRCFFPQGEYLLDNPSFDVSPGAQVSITARDKLSLALDRKISMRSFSGRADEYILEVLEKVGITAAETVLSETTLTFSSTPIFTSRSAIEIISDVLTRLQTEASFRIIQIDDKIRLIQIPITGKADIVFHFNRDMKSPFSRKERANQSRVVTTIKKIQSPTVTADVSLATDSGTEASLPKTIAFSKAIRIEHRQGASDTLAIKEVSRTTTSLTIDRVDLTSTGSWSIAIRGDTTSAIVGEAGPGIDQGGTGLGLRDASGNELNTLLIRRGKTFEQTNGFVTNDGEAQALANILETRFGAPVREMTTSMPFANPTLRINDLYRIIEKYSEDLSLFHMGEIQINFRADVPRLSGKLIGQFANIIEAPQLYDKAFQYNQGRIYDERFPVGEKDQEDLSRRGALVTRTRP